VNILNFIGSLLPSYQVSTAVDCSDHWSKFSSVVPTLLTSEFDFDRSFSIDDHIPGLPYLHSIIYSTSLLYNMEEHCKSLASQYDLFVNNTLKYLDTATERGELYYRDISTNYRLIRNNEFEAHFRFFVATNRQKSRYYVSCACYVIFLCLNPIA